MCISSYKLLAMAESLGASSFYLDRSFSLTRTGKDTVILIFYLYDIQTFIFNDIHLTMYHVWETRRLVGPMVRWLA